MSIASDAVQLKKQKLINKLIKSGVYKKGNKHLYELTLSDLENEYKYIEKKGSGANIEGYKKEQHIPNGIRS